MTRLFTNVDTIKNPHTYQSTIEGKYRLFVRIVFKLDVCFLACFRDPPRLLAQTSLGILA